MHSFSPEVLCPFDIKIGESVLTIGCCRLKEGVHLRDLEGKRKP